MGYDDDRFENLVSAYLSYSPEVMDKADEYFETHPEFKRYDMPLSVFSDHGKRLLYEENVTKNHSMLTKNGKMIHLWGHEVAVNSGRYSKHFDPDHDEIRNGSGANGGRYPNTEDKRLSPEEAYHNALHESHMENVVRFGPT